jgi:hypothetical protein
MEELFYQLFEDLEVHGHVCGVARDLGLVTPPNLALTNLVKLLAITPTQLTGS